MTLTVILDSPCFERGWKTFFQYGNSVQAVLSIKGVLRAGTGASLGIFCAPTYIQVGMKQFCDVTFQYSTGAEADGWEVEYLGRTVCSQGAGGSAARQHCVGMSKHSASTWEK